MSLKATQRLHYRGHEEIHKQAATSLESTYFVDVGTPQLGEAEAAACREDILAKLQHAERTHGTFVPRKGSTRT